LPLGQSAPLNAGRNRQIFGFSENKIPILERTELFIAALKEKAQLKAFELANQLHLKGIKAEIDYEGRSLKAQMRRANKLGARYVLMIGENELETGRGVLREMARKVQEEISLNEAVEVVMGRD
jgi:histidyl-tRNA synthetase